MLSLPSLDVISIQEVTRPFLEMVRTTSKIRADWLNRRFDDTCSRDHSQLVWCDVSGEQTGGLLRSRLGSKVPDLELREISCRRRVVSSRHKHVSIITIPCLFMIPANLQHSFRFTWKWCGRTDATGRHLNSNSLRKGLTGERNGVLQRWAFSQRT